MGTPSPAASSPQRLTARALAETGPVPPTSVCQESPPGQGAWQGPCKPHRAVPSGESWPAPVSGGVGEGRVQERAQGPPDHVSSGRLCSRALFSATSDLCPLLPCAFRPALQSGPPQCLPSPLPSALSCRLSSKLHFSRWCERRPGYLCSGCRAPVSARGATTSLRTRG